MQPPVLDRDAQFAPARQNFLLHLAGHARLLGATMPWGMRIRIGRKRTVGVWCFTETESPSDVVVRLGQRFCYLGITSLFERFVMAFLRGQEKFHNHVPVNATKSFKGEEGAATPREFAV